MEGRQDIHCIPNNENILDDKYSQVLEASIREENKTSINKTSFLANRKRPYP
jgi:hypothetical protein